MNEQQCSTQGLEIQVAAFFIQVLGKDDICTSKDGHPALQMRHFQYPFEENNHEFEL